MSHFLTRRDLALGAAALGLAGPAHAQTGVPPSDAAIRELLVQRIDRQRQAVGMVVAVASPGGRRVVGHGRLAPNDRRTPDGETVYEVGSITKVFTNLLFADMVRKGEIGLDDPLSRHLPPEVKLPERNGRVITLQDLATHTAGLPSFPGVAKVPPGSPDWVFPWYLGTEGFHEPELYAWLADFKLARDPGAQWEYSNIGTSLMGIACCRRAGADYMTLLRRRVLEPLRLRNTGLDPTPAMARRMVVGHEADMQPAPRWRLGAITMGGGLLSTANDLMTFAGAIAPGADSPLSATAEVMLRTRRPMPGGEQAMGWEWLRLPGGDPLISKGGLTRGCSATLMHDPATRTSLVVLCNSDRSPTDIARHLMRPAVPLARSFVAVDVRPQVLEGYLGRYNLPVGPPITIGRMGHGLGLRFGGSSYAPLTPTAQTVFTVFPGNTELEFRSGPGGAVEGVAVRRTNAPEVIATRA